MDILSALKSEASKLEQRLDTLNSAIKALGGGSYLGRGNGRRKRHFSAASRAKMAASQKARWAKIKAAKKNA